jgi:lipopolysaccharide biosynthesis regulator YciM
MGWLSRAFGGDARAPRDVDTALRSALLAVLDRDYDRAEALLTTALRLDSRAVEPYLALARLYRLRGETGRAIRVHQNLLLRLDGSSPHALAALEGLAGDFHQGGFLRRAIATYEELLERAPRHPRALALLPRLHADSRDFGRAIELARRHARAAGTDPGAAEADLRVKMAEAAQAEGRSDDARRAIKRAIRCNKRLARAWLVRGNLEAERGRSKAALAAWIRVPALDRRLAAEVYPKIEATYAALGRPRDFDEQLRRRLAEAPDDAEARLALAHTLAARGEIDAALSELRGLLERDAEHAGARTALGRLLLSERRDAEAVREYRRLLDLVERRGLAVQREALE